MDVAMMEDDELSYVLTFVKNGNDVVASKISKSTDVLASIDTTLKSLLAYIEGEIPDVFRKYIFVVPDQRVHIQHPFCLPIQVLGPLLRGTGLLGIPIIALRRIQRMFIP